MTLAGELLTIESIEPWSVWAPRGIDAGRLSERSGRQARQQRSLRAAAALEAHTGFEPVLPP